MKKIEKYELCNGYLQSNSLFTNREAREMLYSLGNFFKGYFGDVVLSLGLESDADYELDDLAAILLSVSFRGLYFRPAHEYEWTRDVRGVIDAYAASNCKSSQRILHEATNRIGLLPYPKWTLDIFLETLKSEKLVGAEGLGDRRLFTKLEQKRIYEILDSVCESYSLVLDPYHLFTASEPLSEKDSKVHAKSHTIQVLPSQLETFRNACILPLEKELVETRQPSKLPAFAIRRFVTEMIDLSFGRKKKNYDYHPFSLLHGRSKDTWEEVAIDLASQQTKIKRDSDEVEIPFHANLYKKDVVLLQAQKEAFRAQKQAYQQKHGKACRAKNGTTPAHYIRYVVLFYPMWLEAYLSGRTPGYGA